MKYTPCPAVGVWGSGITVEACGLPVREQLLYSSFDYCQKNSLFYLGFVDNSEMFKIRSCKVSEGMFISFKEWSDPRYF